MSRTANAEARKLDPITLEIQWKRLVSMVDEASAAFVRTSFSVLVREANDFAVVLTDARGPLDRAIGAVDPLLHRHAAGDGQAFPRALSRRTR